LRLLLCFITAFGVCLSFAEEPAPLAAKTVGPATEKIPLKNVITKLPDTGWDFLKSSFSRDALPGWALVLGSTGVLYHYDPDILQGVQNDGRRWGLSQSEKTKTVLSIGSSPVLRLPSDAESAMYFLGDGWIDIVAAGAFFTTGALADAPRPYNTSLELVHGLLLTLVFDQTTKRMTGRESPSARTTERGAWRPFTNEKTYHSNTSKYDAMPSGHIMTSALAFTIIRSNYPEYDQILLPFECVYLTALGFAMVNNEVHWASDYPLGIAMGYMIGKAAVRMGKPQDKSVGADKTRWFMYPGVSEEGVSTLNAMVSY
jgi:hypothetical protein